MVSYQHRKKAEKKRKAENAFSAFFSKKASHSKQKNGLPPYASWRKASHSNGP